MIRLLNLGPAKHEKVAIYVVNQRISNVCRIAGAASQRSNSQASVGAKYILSHSNNISTGDSAREIARPSAASSASS